MGKTSGEREASLARMRVYRMAEQNIGIVSLHERVHARCAAYRVEGEPDFTVQTCQADIDRERAKSAREARLEGRPVNDWSDAYLEELALYRQIAERLPARGAFLVHGSAVAVDGQGYLFAARSGMGKSTHAQLWQALLGERFAYVNDDKPLIRRTEKEVWVCGTPYDGKHRLSRNTVVPLRAICLLQRGEKNSIRPMGAREAFPRLLQQVYCPEDPQAFGQTMALLQSLMERVKLYELVCNTDLEAAQVAFWGMGGAL